MRMLILAATLGASALTAGAAVAQTATPTTTPAPTTTTTPLSTVTPTPNVLAPTTSTNPLTADQLIPGINSSLQQMEQTLQSDEQAQFDTNQTNILAGPRVTGVPALGTSPGPALVNPTCPTGSIGC